MRFWSLLLFLILIPLLVFSQNHLLISEIQVSPSADEFIEIFNPNPFPVSLDNLYLSDYNTYYKLVADSFTTNSSDFLVKFPDGASIDSAAVLVVAIDGGAFPGPADFEVKGTSASVPDMVPIHVGSTASLANTSEMAILFYWDGTSDLVEDVDYAIWGNTTSNFTDKTGVSVDGPDADTQKSTYLPDTPVGNQHPFAPAPISGKSMMRISVVETGESLTGGNGITGHDETGEDIAQDFALNDVPDPGQTSLEIPSGSGSGVVTVSPDTVKTDTTVALTFVFKENIADTITSASLKIPADWSWSGNSLDVTLSGAGFAAANLFVTADSIYLSNCQITQADSGWATVSHLQTPAQPGIATFEARTATRGASLKAVSESPQVVVWQPPVATTIAAIQANPGAFGTVTVEAVVTLGGGVTSTTQLSAYIQDNSGRGVNLFSFDPPENFPDVVRGNKLRITGQVEEYVHPTRGDHTTEITNFSYELIGTGQPLPDPLIVTTAGALDTSLEGTLVKTTGTITDMYSAGGGTNIIIDDGSGAVTVRAWDTSNLNLSSFQINDLITVQGIITSYNLQGQILLGYQDDISLVTTNPGDGSGLVTVTPDSVGVGQTGVTLDFSLQGEDSYLLETVALNIPSDWQWSQSETDVQLSGSGFSQATVTVQGNTVLISQAAISQASTGHILLQNLTAPAQDEFSTFAFSTATAGGVLSPVANPPKIKVGQGIAATPISQIQLNTATYMGQEVTILGVVTLGAGITTNSWTDSYVQDNSGYGINVFQSGTVDPKIKRGNLVAVTGTVDEYQGVTEITNYTVEVLAQDQALPTPLKLSTIEATDVQWEGTYIEVQGEITDMFSAGGGTNILLDDGSGPCTIRIWDTAGLNLTAFAVGDTITARGPMDIYQGAGQILVGYQEDIFKPGQGVVGDGSGFAVLDKDSVALSVPDNSVTLTLTGSLKDTIRTVKILLPYGWGWSGREQDVVLSGSGFDGASKKVVLDYGDYWIQIENGAVTDQDSGKVTINKLTTPGFSAYSYFWVQTAVAGGVPQFIANSPFIVVGSQPLTLIKDLQTYSGQFKNPVTIEGVVTVGAGILRTDRTSAYMQDLSGFGINISQAGTPDTTYRRGRMVRLTGTVSEYREATQFSPATVDTFYDGGVLPQPIDLSTAEANNPRWDGTLIRVHGVVTEKYSTSTQQPFDYNISVNDGTGPTLLRIWGTTGINLDSIDVNSAIIAKGVGAVFVDREGKANYQILPAYQDDITLDKTYQPTLEGVSLEVPPNPFVPDRGETIRIRYNAGAVNNHVTVRIFDMAGRLITTLLDEDATLIVNTFEWNGKDLYHNYVPLGTYICHLEVMEPKTAKKRTRVAPIVVGTILKK